MILYDIIWYYMILYDTLWSYDIHHSVSKTLETVLYTVLLPSLNDFNSYHPQVSIDPCQIGLEDCFPLNIDHFQGRTVTVIHWRVQLINQNANDSRCFALDFPTWNHRHVFANHLDSQKYTISDTFDNCQTPFPGRISDMAEENIGFYRWYQENP